MNIKVSWLKASWFACGAVVMCGCVVIILVLGSGAPAQDTEDALVRQFFPQWLAAEANKELAQGGPTPFQAYAFQDADLNGTGIADFIIAAYSNGFSGAVVVLRKVGTSAVTVAAPSFPLMGGVYPSIRMLDVDHDRRPEAVVSFTSARGQSADWVLKWNGTTLQSIGPVSVEPDGNIATLLSEAEFVDLNGDDTLEIISAPQSGLSSNGQEAKEGLRVFSLANGTYTDSGITFNLFATFVRGVGPPNAAVRKFAVPDPANGQYLMTIVNGNNNGDNLASSATIVLNGATIAGPNLFNQRRRTFQIPITVAAANTLTVTIAGAPASEITVGIGPRI
jgi:hypothetical protein